MSMFNNWLAQVLEIERLALASYYELGLAWCSHLGLGRPRAGVTGKGRSQRTAAITRQNPMGLSPDLRTGSTTKGRGLAASLQSRLGRVGWLPRASDSPTVKQGYYSVDSAGKTAWLQMLPLLPSCITLGKQLHLSEP